MTGLLDFLALIVQFAAIGLPIVVKLFELGHNYHYTSAKNFTDAQNNVSGILPTHQVIIININIYIIIIIIIDCGHNHHHVLLFHQH